MEKRQFLYSGFFLFNQETSYDFLAGLVSSEIVYETAIIMTIPWNEAFITGQLMGTKVVLTEFVAYVRFGQLPVEELTERTRIIMTYALCGFANFVSLGIMVTGLVTMVPERKVEIMDMGLKAIVAGTIATCTTATLVGIIITL